METVLHQATRVRFSEIPVGQCCHAYGGVFMRIEPIGEKAWQNIVDIDTGRCGFIFKDAIVIPLKGGFHWEPQ